MHRPLDVAQRRASRTSIALKNRRVRFTATAQEHVRREKAWWLANRDHPDVFTEELLNTYIDYKRSKEVDAVRLRPHPFEFALYYDI